jgi:hypothetical protein
MRIKNKLYLDLFLNSLCIAMLIGLYFYSVRQPEALMGYLFWWVLKIVFVLVALCAGYFVKDFWRLVCFLTFALVVYSLATIFEQMREGFYLQLFFVTYTIFLGFASIANMSNKFLNWALVK